MDSMEFFITDKKSADVGRLAGLVTWSSISRCCPVTATVVLISFLWRNALTTGIILIAYFDCFGTSAENDQYMRRHTLAPKLQVN